MNVVFVIHKHCKEGVIPVLVTRSEMKTYRKLKDNNDPHSVFVYHLDTEEPCLYKYYMDSEIFMKDWLL